MVTFWTFCGVLLPASIATLVRRAPEMDSAFRSARNHFHRVVRSAKAKHWSNWLHRVEQLQRVCPCAAARVVRRRFRKSVCRVAPRLSPGSLATLREQNDCMNRWRTHFRDAAPMHVEHFDARHCSRVRRRMQRIRSIRASPCHVHGGDGAQFTLAELKTALQHCHLDKAPGCDKIPYRALCVDIPWWQDAILTFLELCRLYGCIQSVRLGGVELRGAQVDNHLVLTAAAFAAVGGKVAPSPPTLRPAATGRNARQREQTHRAALSLLRPRPQSRLAHGEAARHRQSHRRVYLLRHRRRLHARSASKTGNRQAQTPTWQPRWRAGEGPNGGKGRTPGFDRLAVSVPWRRAARTFPGKRKQQRMVVWAATASFALPCPGYSARLGRLPTH